MIKNGYFVGYYNGFPIFMHTNNCSILRTKICDCIAHSDIDFIEVEHDRSLNCFDIRENLKLIKYLGVRNAQQHYE